MKIVGVQITKVDAHSAGVFPAEAFPSPHPALKLPAFCRVDGVLDRRTGADGKSYGIRFAVALPYEWNGRLFFQGGGGSNGFLVSPIGFVYADPPALARGFAVVSTDTGHEQTEPFDLSFMADQQAALDFGYVAIGRVTEIAKTLAAFYYERSPERSYFFGCSEGGREGMVFAERYPMYFDGIIVGAPFMKGDYQSLALRFVAASLNRRTVDSSGHAVFTPLFSEQDRKLVVDQIVNACDAADGLKDGLIFNTQACKFDPSTLACGPDRRGRCLAPEQVSALKKVLAGPKDSKGRQVYPGYPPDGGLGAILQGSNPFAGPDTVIHDIDKEATAAASSPLTVLTTTETLTNLTTFASHGGKLLFYHGMSDPLISAAGTIDYYERLIRDNGGREKVNGFSRLFLVPGMEHCSGGMGLDKFDVLQTIVDWVEQGKASDRLTASGSAFSGGSRPLCAYPAHAHYNGRGDTEKAESFECRK